MKDRIYLMRDWFFTEEFTEDMIVDTMDVSLAQTVSLPHTCKETPYHYFDEHTYQMVSCYQKILYAPEGWQGKRLLLTFEAVGHERFMSMAKRWQNTIVATPPLRSIYQKP